MHISPRELLRFSWAPVILLMSVTSACGSDESAPPEVAMLTWDLLEADGAPGARGYHGMAYDAGSDRVILYGGENASYQDTWAFDTDTGQWELMNPDPSPGRAAGFGVAYDSESDRVVLYGGTGLAAHDTWAYDYDTDTWTKMNPDTTPPARFGHRMVYDEESDLIVMFGGAGSGALASGTWTYDVDSDTWTEMSPQLEPALRAYHAMSYDPTIDRVVLFGGGSGFPRYSEVYADTWTYDANSDTWELTVPAASPPARVYAAAAYSRGIGGIVLFGGGSQSFDEPLLEQHDLGELWVFDGATTSWTEVFVTNGPSPRKKHAVASDAASDALIVFGGDTWDSEGNSGDFQNETWILEIG